MDLWTPMRPWVFHPRVAEGEGPGATSVWLERSLGPWSTPAHRDKTAMNGAQLRSFVDTASWRLTGPPALTAAFSCQLSAFSFSEVGRGLWYPNARSSR